MNPRGQVMDAVEEPGSKAVRVVYKAAWILAIGIGAFALLGWSLGVKQLHEPPVGSGDMGLSTAICLVLGGLSLWYWRVPEPEWRLYAGRICGVATVAIGGQALAKYVLSWTTAPGFSMGGASPSMAFNTAIAIVLAGCALCLLDTRTARGRCPSEWLALGSAVAPFAALVGHIYGVHEFTNPFMFSRKVMALNSAVGILALCIAILTSKPERGWMARVMKNTPEGLVARRLLPAGTAILLMLGWLTQIGEELGLYDHDDAGALLVTASVVTLGILIRQSMKALAALESHRQTAEAELHRSEERLGLALEAAHIATWELDFATNEVTWSSPIEEIFGVPHGELDNSGINFLQRIHPDDRDLVVSRAQRAAAGIDERYQVEYRIHRPDGTIRWIASRGEVFRDPSGRPIRLAGTSMDITERKLLERELIEMSNREQRRLGQDLHDDLGQWLTGIHLQARAFAMKLEGRFEPDAMEARRIADNIAEAIKRTRMLAHGMASAAIETEGLSVALQNLATNTEQISQVCCNCECDAELTFRDPEASLQLYRIAQEAITNAIRHGEASEVWLSIEASESGRARLVIRDNGKGIPMPLPASSGLGLRIMQYRAGLVGGTLDVSRAESGGTEVVCSFPRQM